MLIFFLFKRAPLLIKRAHKQIYKGKKLDKKRVKKLRILTRVYRFFRDNIIYLKSLLTDWLLLYYILYTAFAILGMFNPVFVALLLFDLFLRWAKLELMPGYKEFSLIYLSISNRFPVLLHVLNSLWRPRYQILLTIVLFLILGYVFTFIAYYFLHESFEDLCENFLGCFSLIFDTTFKVSRIRALLKKLNIENSK